MSGHHLPSPAANRDSQVQLVSAIPNSSTSVDMAISTVTQFKAELPITVASVPTPLHPRLQQTGLTLALVGAAIALYKLDRLLDRSSHSQ